jgi:hypothetical protein
MLAVALAGDCQGTLLYFPAVRPKSLVVFKSVCGAFELADIP